MFLASEGKYIVNHHIVFNPLNAKLNAICHLLALLVAHHILHISRVRVNIYLNSTDVPKQLVNKHHKA